MIIMFNNEFGLTDAVLQGRKTQTRRTIKLPIGMNFFDFGVDEKGKVYAAFVDAEGKDYDVYPKYQIGEEVAIAQPYKDIELQIHVPETENEFGQNQSYHIYGDTAGWHNKMFVKAELMPHRIRIDNVRVERLQDISDEDCLKEGVIRFCGRYAIEEYDQYGSVCRRYCFTSPREAFAFLIGKTCGKVTWESNPWAFVYDFKPRR